MPKCESICVFSDGTGLQAVAGGEYLREKYGKKNRRWVQIVILGDPVTKEPVSYEVNIIPESEPDSAQHQMEELLKAGIDIASFGGDGAFDKMELWNFLKDQGTPPIIKPDKNALDDTDNDIRNKHAKEQKEKLQEMGKEAQVWHTLASNRRHIQRDKTHIWRNTPTQQAKKA